MNWAPTRSLVPKSKAKENGIDTLIAHRANKTSDNNKSLYTYFNAIDAGQYNGPMRVAQRTMIQLAKILYAQRWLHLTGGGQQFCAKMNGRCGISLHVASQRFHIVPSTRHLFRWFNCVREWVAWGAGWLCLRYIPSSANGNRYEDYSDTFHRFQSPARSPRS